MKTKIALLAGGYTEEAKVSYKSAAFVYENIDKDKFDVYLIRITKGKWAYLDDEGEEYEIDKNDFTLSKNGEKIIFDLVFIMIHGIPGEDGQLQGYFDLLGIKYTGCGLLSSALTMNKGYTKSVLQGVENLYMAKSLVFHRHEQMQAKEKIIEELRFPVFVKPNNGGSSIGMSKVNSKEEVEEALDKAFRTGEEAREVIVEEFIQGREFTQGVYRSRKGEVELLPASEVVTTRDFFDFDAKYVPGLTEEITPADISKEKQEEIGEILKEMYIKLNCKGMVRIDFFLQKETDDFYFVEVNTVPGQTEQSFIPQQVRAKGMTEKDFYTDIIESALVG